MHAAHPRDVLPGERDHEVGVVELGDRGLAAAVVGTGMSSESDGIAGAPAHRHALDHVGARGATPSGRARAHAGWRPPSPNGRRCPCTGSRREDPASEGHATAPTRARAADSKPTKESSCRTRSCCCATVRARGTSIEPVHRLGRRRPHRRRASDQARRAGSDLASAGIAPDRRAHVGPAPRDPHRRARAPRVRTVVDTGSPVVAAQRAPLRRAPGQGQGRDRARSSRPSR